MNPAPSPSNLEQLRNLIPLPIPDRTLSGTPDCRNSVVQGIITQRTILMDTLVRGQMKPTDKLQSAGTARSLLELTAVLSHERAIYLPETPEGQVDPLDRAVGLLMGSFTHPPVPDYRFSYAKDIYALLPESERLQPEEIIRRFQADRNEIDHVKQSGQPLTKDQKQRASTSSLQMICLLGSKYDFKGKGAEFTSEITQRIRDNHLGEEIGELVGLKFGVKGEEKTVGLWKSTIPREMLFDEQGFPKSETELEHIKKTILINQGDSPLRMAENLTTLDEDQRKGLNLRKILEQVKSTDHLRVLATNGHVSIYALRIPQTTPPALDMIIAVGPDCQAVVLEETNQTQSYIYTTPFTRSEPHTKRATSNYTIFPHGIVAAFKKSIGRGGNIESLVYVGNDGELKKGPDCRWVNSREAPLPDGSGIFSTITVDKDGMNFRQWYRLDSSSHNFDVINDLDGYDVCSFDADPQSPRYYFFNRKTSDIVFADNQGHFRHYPIPSSLTINKHLNSITITRETIENHTRYLRYLPLYPESDQSVPGSVGILAIGDDNSEWQIGLCAGEDSRDLFQKNTPFTNPVDGLVDGLIVYKDGILHVERTLRLQKDGNRLIWVRDEPRMTDSPDKGMDYNATVRTILRRMAANTPSLKSILKKGKGDYCHPTQRIDDLFTLLSDRLGKNLLKVLRNQENTREYPGADAYDARLLPPLRNAIISSMEEIGAKVRESTNIQYDITLELRRRINNLDALLNALPQ